MKVEWSAASKTLIISMGYRGGWVVVDWLAPFKKGQVIISNPKLLDHLNRPIHNAQARGGGKKRTPSGQLVANNSD